MHKELLVILTINPTMVNSGTESVIEVLEERRGEWLEILTDLIKIPSENPPGDTTEAAAYIAKLFDEKGISYTEIAPVDTKPNIVGSFDGGEGDPSEGNHLVFNGHLDTFPRGETDRWDDDPFSGKIDDGKIHGRGAADMLGGFTASLAAFIYLFENADDVNGSVTFTAVSDEESGGKWGTKYVLDTHPEYRGDAAIIGEPSSNDIIRFGGRGMIWLDIELRGESGHSAFPEGTNAIEALIELVRVIDDEVKEQVVLPEDIRDLIRDGEDVMDEVFGRGATEYVLHSQTNFNNVKSWGPINIVPEKARARVDIRLPIGASSTELIAQIEETSSRHPGEIHIDVLNHADPTYSDVQHSLLVGMQQSAGEVRNGAAPIFSCGLPMTDARFYRERGIPCAVYGPTPHNIGSQNEYIQLEDFMDVVKTHTLSSIKYLNTA